MVSEGNLTLAFIIGYLLLTLGIGTYVYKYGERDEEDYFLSGRSVGWVLLPLTIVASLQGTFALIGASAVFYSSGIGFIVLIISQAWLPLMLLYFGWRLWALGKRHGYITLHEFFEHRFNSSGVKYVAGIISFSMMFAYATLQLVGAGRAIAGVTPISFQTALGIAIFFTAIYVAAGGMRGVIYTDAIQVVVLIISVIAIGVIVTGHVGPISSLPDLFKQVNDVKPTLLSLPGPGNAYPPLGWIMQFIVLPFGIFLQPHMWARIFSANDEQSLASSAIAIPISQVIIFATSVLFAGIAGWVIFGSVTAPDTIVPRMLNEYMPWYIAAFITAGVVAAGKSSVDSMVLVLSQIFTVDYVQDFTELDERQRELLSRGLVIVVSIAMFLFGRNPPDVFVNVIVDVAFAGIAMLAPTFVAALYWRRANKWGALSGMTVGFVVLFFGKLLGITYSTMVPNSFVAFVLNVGLLVGVSYLTSPPPAENVEETIGYIDALRLEDIIGDSGSGDRVPADD